MPVSRVRDLKQELEQLNLQVAGTQREIIKKDKELKDATLSAVLACEDLKSVRWQLRKVPNVPGAYVLESDGKPGEPADILDLTDTADAHINLGFCTFFFVKNRLHLTTPDGSLKSVVTLMQRFGYRIHPTALAELRAEADAVFEKLGNLHLKAGEVKS